MQIADWQIKLVQLIAAAVAASPEQYTGGLEINSNGGAVSDIKLHITFRPGKDMMTLAR